MDKKNIAKLQSAVGATADGILGVGTLTSLFLKLGCPSKAIAESLAISANVHLSENGILDTPLRFAHFIGQCAKESGGFRYMEEIASGSAYENRLDLGNTQKGDGVRYKGRGSIQLTGRSNYRRVGRKIGLNLEGNPTLVSDPSVGMWVSIIFWSDKNLNKVADTDDVKAVTKIVNGGYNGLDERIIYTNRMKGWLGI